MTPEETAAVVHRLTVAFSTPITESLLGIWHDHMVDKDTETAFAATDALIAEHAGFMPTIAKFNEAYRAQRRKSGIATQDDRCPALCDSGWLYTLEDGRDVVTKCSNSWHG